MSSADGESELKSQKKKSDETMTHHVLWTIPNGAKSNAVSFSGYHMYTHSVWIYIRATVHVYGLSWVGLGPGLGSSEQQVLILTLILCGPFQSLGGSDTWL